jgi:hypothetical protein
MFAPTQFRIIFSSPILKPEGPSTQHCNCIWRDGYRLHPPTFSVLSTSLSRSTETVCTSWNSFVAVISEMIIQTRLSGCGTMRETQDKSRTCSITAPSRDRVGYRYTVTTLRAVWNLHKQTLSDQFRRTAEFPPHVSPLPGRRTTTRPLLSRPAVTRPEI